MKLVRLVLRFCSIASKVGHFSGWSIHWMLCVIIKFVEYSLQEFSVVSVSKKICGIFNQLEPFLFLVA